MVNRHEDKHPTFRLYHPIRKQDDCSTRHLQEVGCLLSTSHIDLSLQAGAVSKMILVGAASRTKECEGRCLLRIEQRLHAHLIQQEGNFLAWLDGRRQNQE